MAHTVIKSVFKKEDKGQHGFNFVYDEEVPANTEVLLRMPSVNAFTRSVNDIGWMTDGTNVDIYATLCEDLVSNTMWEKVEENYDINKTASGLRIVNSGSTPARVVIRVIMC